MSYSIKFQKNTEVCQLPFAPPKGGTSCVDEDFRDACLNITCNYASVFRKYNVTIHWHEDDPPTINVLENKTAMECVRILTPVIPRMGNESNPDYWKATEGNAKMALMNLLMIALAVPQDAICVVS